MRAFVLLVTAVAGIVAWLYLISFAGILIVAYTSGQFVIKGDSLMLIESFLLLSASVLPASMVVHSLRLIGSEMRLKPKPLHERAANRAAAVRYSARAAPGVEAELSAFQAIQDQVR
jgi:hypothetical protein